MQPLAAGPRIPHAEYATLIAALQPFRRNGCRRRIPRILELRITSLRDSWAGGAARGALGGALGCQAAQRQNMENLSDAQNPEEVIFHCELGSK